MTIEKKFIGGDKPLRKLVEYKKAPEEEKKEIFKELKETKESLRNFSEQENISLTRKQEEILKIIYSEIDKYSDKYGISKDIFKDIKIFFLPSTAFNKFQKLIKEKIKGKQGIYRGEYEVLTNTALIRYYWKYKSNKDLINWTVDSIHELLHSRSYQALQICGDKTGESQLKVSRTGPYILKENEKGVGTYFGWLNEALVTELSLKIARNIVNQNGDLFAKEFERAKKDGQEPEELIPESAGYIFYRKVLNKLIKGVAEQKGKSPEKIFEMFSKSLFTGKLLEVARLVEEIYGPGSFRVLANVDEYTLEDALKYVNPDLSPKHRRKLARNIIRGKKEKVAKAFEKEYENYQRYLKLRKKNG